jgi:gliding-associated putative ABC transporter substrate-binding component GldG
MRKNLFQNILSSKVLLVLGILVFVNIISSYINGFIDLTADKRFTLTEPTKNLVSNIDELVTTKVYLVGEFPSGITSLQEATTDLLKQFKKLNNNFLFDFEDPSVGTVDEINARYKQLTKDGLIPTSLKVFDGGNYQQKVIFPYVTFQIGTRKVVVNLLEEQFAGQDDQEVLNASISLLEFKLSNALQKLLLTRKMNIVFTSGQGELPLQKTYSLERDLRKFYNTGRITLDSVLRLDSLIDLLVIAAPKSKFSLQNQFKIDQYLMNGGKILWLIEKMNASLDSIGKYQFFIPQDIVTDLDNMLFKYGARVMPNLILDLESTSIPQIVGQSGDKPQTMMFKWPYHPVLASKSDHPIVKNIDRVNMYFPSQVDTVKTNVYAKKTFLMTTSNYSKTQFNPVRLNFEILKVDPDPRLFNKPNIPVAVLLEGRFESFFKNRMTQDFSKTLAGLNMKFKDESVQTKQIIVSDADFMSNLVNSRTNEAEPLGFNKWELKLYKGNKDFIMNAIEYLMDEKQILTSRSKEIKLRPLDNIKVNAERTYWQIFNVVMPLLLLSIFGLIYFYFRRKKYARTLKSKK